MKKKIEIKMEKKGTDPENHLMLPRLIFLLIGVWSILLSFHSMNGVQFSEWIIYSAAAIFCTLNWYLYVYQRSLFYWIFTAWVFLLGVMIFIQWDVLRQQFDFIKNNFIGNSIQEPISVTRFALLFALFLSWLVFLLEFLFKNHSIFSLIISYLLFLTPFWGIRMKMGTILLLILFQMIFFVFHKTGVRKKRSLFVEDSYVLVNQSSMVMGGIVMIAFFIALPLTYSHIDQLYQYAYEGERRFIQMLSDKTGVMNDPVQGGYISRMNHYQTGEKQLTLSVNQKPTETIYLKGFTGGTYDYGDFFACKGEEFLQEDIFSPRTLGEMYFLSKRNNEESELGAEESSSEIRTILIEYEYKNPSYYTPYYSRLIGHLAARTGELYEYYERTEMDASWHTNTTMNDYKELEQKFLREAKTIYTEVPTEQLPKLTNLCEQNPFEDLDDITAFILYTLHSNASYTLMPGWGTFHEDIVEYFLFERKKGYCVHFAAAATLMYRLYGIPARYASGYMVSPSEFERQENGEYTAVVTDDDAHAWTEIFVEGYGWIPIEVTPASDGSSAAVYPGFDTETLEEQLEKHNWDMNHPSLLQETKKGESGERVRGDFINFFVNVPKTKHLLEVFPIGVIGIGCLMLFLFYKNRNYQLKKQQYMECRLLFSRLMSMLHFGGYLKEYDSGLEEDFAQKLSEAIPSISSEEAIQFLNIMNEAAYGEREPDTEKKTFIRTIYEKAAVVVYLHLNWYQKIWFRYGRGFG